MEINKIKKLKDNKYQILFSDGTKLITYDEIILNNNILYKKELSLIEYENIIKENDYYSVYNDSIKYLTKKIHSKLEYIKYIEKYNLNTKDKNKLILAMERLNLLNDKIYVKAYINDKFYLNDDGILKIKNDLLKQEIDEKIIDEEIKNISKVEELEKLQKLVNKKIKVLKGSNYQIQQKILYNLVNLGYNKEDIELYLNDIDDSKSLEKDFEKYYRELSRKQIDYEKLYFKLKQKLYSRGYSLSSIDEIINKKRN